MSTLLHTIVGKQSIFGKNKSFAIRTEGRTSNKNESYLDVYYHNGSQFEPVTIFSITLPKEEITEKAQRAAKALQTLSEIFSEGS